jgi:hypothetical protein
MRYRYCYKYFWSLFRFKIIILRSFSACIRIQIEVWILIQIKAFIWI